MPDNSSTPPNGQVTTGELNLDQPAVEQPRMKRRSLKPKPAAATPLPDEPRKEPFGSPSPAAARPATPGVVIHPEPQSGASRPAAASVPPANSATSARPGPSIYRTSPPSPHPSSNPNPYRSTVAPSSSTRPAGDERKEKEDASSMKTTTAAAPTSSSSTTSSFAPRSTAAATGAPFPRSGSVVDYRANIERQAREQKSIGGIITYIVYALAAFFVISAVLAGYGAYTLSKQIQHQSMTLSDLDARYSEQNRQLDAQIKSVDESLTDALNQTRAQLNRQQEIIIHQQESINALIAQNAKLTDSENATEATLRQERQYRAYETASLRTRVHALEDLNRQSQ